MPTLIFEAPGPDTPGFLNRQRRATDFFKTIQDAGGFEQVVVERGGDFIDDMIDFLLPFVTEPEERAQARQALEFQATERQIMDLLNAIQGIAPEPPKGEQNGDPFGLSPTESERASA